MNYGDLVPLPKLVSCIMYYVCCRYKLCMYVWYYYMYFFIIMCIVFINFTCPLNFFVTCKAHDF